MKHHGLTVGSIININVLTFGPPLELDNDMVWKNGYIITSLIKHAKWDDFTQQKKTKSMNIHMKHHGLTVGSIMNINVLTFGPPLELDNDMVCKNGYIITSHIKHTKRDNFTKQKK